MVAPELNCGEVEELGFPAETAATLELPAVELDVAMLLVVLSN